MILLRPDRPTGSGFQPGFGQRTRLLRPMIARRRALLGKLCNIVERLFARFYASARPGARPGIILFVQTFGDLVNFNPHIHVLAADGAFDADGGFRVLPPIPRKVLEHWFRKDDLALLRREGLVSEALAEKMLAWRHTGFSAHNAVRVRARDAAGRRRLAQYMLRAPFSLEKMSYEPVSGTVIYRSTPGLGSGRMGKSCGATRPGAD